MTNHYATRYLARLPLYRLNNWINTERTAVQQALPSPPPTTDTRIPTVNKDTGIPFPSPLEADHSQAGSSTPTLKMVIKRRYKAVATAGFPVTILAETMASPAPKAQERTVHSQD
jgi:hypothetical protein